MAKAECLLTLVQRAHENARLDRLEPWPFQKDQALLGVPADVSLSVARDQGADLIAMSSHGLGRADRFPLGSVALRVLMAAPVTVLIERTPRSAA